ncbi:MAG: hypothetical protein OS130_09340 [Thermodesulfobacteriota bacterium]|jgi:hypothetical protein|nr:MAG: hypothetical protein OS130_09340 [Thermodesulfobacteriota bacterium]
MAYRNREATLSATAIDPVAPMAAVDNRKLRTVAEEVRAKLKRVIDNL